MGPKKSTRVRSSATLRDERATTGAPQQTEASSQPPTAGSASSALRPSIPASSSSSPNPLRWRADPSSPSPHSAKAAGAASPLARFVSERKPPSAEAISWVVAGPAPRSGSLRATCRVRLSIESARSAGLVMGDVVVLRRTVGQGEFEGSDQNPSVAVVWPVSGQPEDEIRLSPHHLNHFPDGTRVSLVRPTFPICEAASVTLRPSRRQGSDLVFDDALNIFGHEVLLDIRYVSIDGSVSFNYAGLPRSFVVESARDVWNAQKAIGGQSQPSIFEITRRTTVSFHEAKEEKRNDANGAKSKNGSRKSGFTAVGGLEKEVELLKELVQLALFEALRFTRVGLRPPRGALLYGPPGTGKTLIARAVAEEVHAHFTLINGPEVISKFYGETEEKLRSIFATAKENAPSIIFIDEIDSLCPKREDSSSDLEKRIVACLLTLLDGSSSKPMDSAAQSHDGIFVLAATNRPHVIDEALRRPGRFDREIEIGIPTPSARLDILSRLVQGVPNNLTLDNLKHIASVTHGFVGADLAGVVREAGMRAIRRIKSGGQSQTVEITFQEAMEAVGSVRPSSMREIMLEVPKVLWSDIGGNDEIKQKLKEAVEWPLKHPEAFSRFNIRPPKGVLLYGPPGCSKTLLAKALATESGLNFLAVKGPELFSKWVGESEKAVRELFKKARAASPAIVFFDEIDALAVSRSSDGDGPGSAASRVLSQLLSELDGIEPLVGVTVVAATNRPDVLDPALLRPGRFDRVVRVHLPDDLGRRAIWRMWIGDPAGAGGGKMRVASDVDIEFLVRKQTAGYTGAEIVAVCQEAGMAAMEANPETATHVEMSHFLVGVARVTPRVTKEMEAFFERFERRG
ncbi:P-loop containing nucleoside triphosphate hydrolase protein [Zopfochytrium polystomum]|nr:P-loop containing nucleoside triphosphate hydrolase protein [Zopfochytrium polystomum]